MFIIAMIGFDLLLMSIIMLFDVGSFLSCCYSLYKDERVSYQFVPITQNLLFSCNPLQVSLPSSVSALFMVAAPLTAHCLDTFHLIIIVL